MTLTGLSFAPGTASFHVSRGETPAQATDRLTMLDSAERLKVMRQTRDAEARARKIREQMAAEAARAAAARYSPE